MSLQVHCDNCNDSLEEIVPTHDRFATEPEYVVINIGPPTTFAGNALVDPNRRAFCDWNCAGQWCGLKHDGDAE